MASLTFLNQLSTWSIIYIERRSITSYILNDVQFRIANSFPLRSRRRRWQEE
jgi:hypothetical protein